MKTACQLLVYVKLKGLIFEAKVLIVGVLTTIHWWNLKSFPPRLGKFYMKNASSAEKLLRISQLKYSTRKIASEFSVSQDEKFLIWLTHGFRFCLSNQWNKSNNDETTEVLRVLKFKWVKQNDCVYDIEFIPALKDGKPTVFGLMNHEPYTWLSMTCEVCCESVIACAPHVRF